MQTLTLVEISSAENKDTKQYIIKKDEKLLTITAGELEFLKGMYDMLAKIICVSQT